MTECSNCGYPVIQGMHYCPNCGAEVAEGMEHKEDLEPVAMPSHEEEYAQEPVDEDEVPICTLRPIQQPGERAMPEEVYDEDTKEVMLARYNTVPNDISIDDELQACLFYTQGHWWIEDRSQDESTYVHAGAGIKLEPGDIIRMGTREFEFNIKKRKN